MAHPTRRSPSSISIRRGTPLSYSPQHNCRSNHLQPRHRTHLTFRRIVTGLNLQTLLDRLGVKGPVQHTYDDTVFPVALIDAGQVTLTATTAPQPLGTPATAGELVAPLANTRLADTGPLAGGAWNITIALNANDPNNFRLRRRNAADAADIWSQRLSISTAAGITFIFLSFRITLVSNERLVLENISAAVAGTIYQASIWTQGPF